MSQNEKVYVVIGETYYEQETILGVFKSKENADKCSFDFNKDRSTISSQVFEYDLKD